MHKLLIVIYFWVYGLRGAVLTGSMVGDALMTIILSVALYFLIKSDLDSDCSIDINSSSLIKFGLILGALVLIVNTKLLYPLSFDQFYYAQQSLFHSTYVIDRATFIVDLSDISNLPYKYVVQLFSLFIACGLVIIGIYSLKAPLVFTILFLTIRAISLVFGGIQNTHPPLQLLPLLSSSAVLGIHEFSFRITQLIPIAIIFWVSIKLLTKKMGLKGLFISFSACTFPLLLHTGTLVESSIYTAMSVFIVLSVIYYKDRFTTNELLFLTLLVGISPLIRIPAFLGTLVLYGFYILYDRAFLVTFAKHHVFISLTWIPYVVYSIMRGTPATNESQLMTPSISLEQRLDVIMNGLPEWYFLFLIVPLIFTFKKPKGTTLIWGSYFLASCFVFTEIRESLVYTDRYKAEYILPFVMFGCTMGFILLLNSNRKIVVNTLLSFSLILTITNITQFWRYTTNIDQRFTTNSPKKSTSLNLTEVNYPYRAILEGVDEKDNLLIAGITYGVIPQIISGWSIAEILSTKDTYKEAGREMNWASFDLYEINQKTKVEKILTTNIISDKLREDLKKLGFEAIDSTVFKPHETTSYLYHLKKKEE